MVFSWMFLLSSGYSLHMAVNHVLMVWLEAPGDYVQHQHWEAILGVSAILASSPHHWLLIYRVATSVLTTSRRST